MDKHLDAFLDRHPTGWGHDEWLALLDDLRRAGIDVGDAEVVGHALEGRRLARVLNDLSIKGLGAKRIEAIVARFETLWRARHAQVEDVAAIRTVPAALAAKVVEALGSIQ